MDLLVIILTITDVGMSIGVITTIWLSTPMLKVLYWLKKNHIELDPAKYFAGASKTDLSQYLLGDKKR